MLQNQCKGMIFNPDNQKKTQKKSQTWWFFLIGIDYAYNVRQYNLDYFMEDIMEL